MGVFPPLLMPLQEAVKLMDNADTTFESDVRSANWDGGGTLASGKDATATAGYLIDYSSGSAQFQNIYTEGGTIGALDIVDTLTLLTGGLIRSAASGARVQFKSYADASSAEIEFYTGIGTETKPPKIQGGEGFYPNSAPFVTIYSGYLSGVAQDSSQIIVYAAKSGQNGGIDYKGDDHAWFNNAGTSTLVLDKGGDLTLPSGSFISTSLGSAASPVLGIGGAADEGVYSRINGELNFATSGAEKMRLTNGGNLHIAGSAIYFDTIGGNDWIELYEIGNYFRIAIDGAERLRIDSGGDLGISGTKIYFDAVTGGNDYIQMPEASNYFRVVLDGTQRLRIDTVGALTVASWVGDFLMSGDQIKFGSSTSDYIQRSEASNYFRMVQDGTETHRFTEGGDISIAGTKIYFDAVSGGNDFISLTESTSQFKITIDGIEELILGASGFLVPNAYSSTSGSAANVYVASDGRLYRSTSARRYKTGETPAPALADIRLEPVAFIDMEGVRRVGQIADDLADQNPMLGTYGPDGDIEDFDMKAWAAVVAAKLNRLEEAASWK